MKDNSKMLIGLAGECDVVKTLALRGWVSSLAYNNCPTFDIFCFNPETKQTVTIQVKTIKDKEKGKVHAFPIMGNHEEREQFYKEVTGPYVFVHIDINNNISHYILSRNQFVKLSSQIENDYEYDKDGNKKNLKPAPMAMPRKYILDYKDEWDNIWKE